MVTEIKNRNWFRKHWIISIIIGFFVVGMFGAILDTDSESSSIKNSLNSGASDSTEESVIMLNSIENEMVEAILDTDSESSSIKNSLNSGTSDFTEEGAVVLNSLENEMVEKLITKSPMAILPSDTEIDTEWEIIKREEFSIENTGFNSGAKLEIDRLEGLTLSTGYVFVYKFDSIIDANSYYQSEVDITKEERGYTEISSPIKEECFAIKSGDYLGGYYKWAICKKLNIVFISEVASFSNWRIDYYKDLAEITSKKIS